MDKASNTKEKINLDDFSHEELNEMGKRIGDKIAKIGDGAALKINRLLDSYGLSAKILVQLRNKETGEVINIPGEKANDSLQ